MKLTTLEYLNHIVGSVGTASKFWILAPVAFWFIVRKCEDVNQLAEMWGAIRQTLPADYKHDGIFRIWMTATGNRPARWIPVYQDFVTYKKVIEKEAS
jgi:hypothetical protein